MTAVQQTPASQLPDTESAAVSAPRRRMARRLGAAVLPAYALLAYVFLFAPIVVVVIFSFNAGQHVSSFEGFSFRWYETAWTDPSTWRRCATAFRSPSRPGSSRC